MSTVVGRRAPSPPSWRSRAWAITAALSITETVSWGVLYYAFAAGRILFALLAPGSRVVTALIGGGITVFAVAGEHPAALIGGLVLLGMGNGMTTLVRATDIADRYGPAAYGSLSSTLALVTTVARAGGPIAGAALAALAGYQFLLWSLVAVCVAAGTVMPANASDSRP